jgi:UPF0042 nucleotide-binding protein
MIRLISCGTNHMREQQGPEWEQWVEADVQLPLRGVLSNPFKVADMRDLGGLDASVQEFVAAQPQWPALRDRVLFAVRKRLGAGEQVVTVATQCSGGHDRSVAAAELLGAELRTWPRVDVVVRHLHLYRRHPWVAEHARLGR